MRKQTSKILILVVILNLLFSLNWLMTVQARQDRASLPRAQTHAVLVENASPTW
ncbi:MAG TPA: hypothetical protein VMT04_09900 [Terriglobales bacterium]|nr:hypothetical protein [Terriglobales bacterium]